MQSIGNDPAYVQRQKRTAPRPAPVQHRTTYHDVEGLAVLRQGGYTFYANGSPEAHLVSYKDSDLVLLGRTDLVAEEDTRPLWQIVADPATHNGTYGRDLVRGR